MARDQGTPSQQATRRLNIIVRDIDDHPPQFIRTPVCFYLLQVLNLCFKKLRVSILVRRAAAIQCPRAGRAWLVC